MVVCWEYLKARGRKRIRFAFETVKSTVSCDVVPDLVDFTSRRVAPLSLHGTPYCQRQCAGPHRPSLLTGNCEAHVCSHTDCRSWPSCQLASLCTCRSQDSFDCPCSALFLRPCSAFAEADTRGWQGWLATPSLRKKQIILQRISRLRLYC